MNRALFMGACLALAGSAAVAGERTVKLSVSNMTCAVCPVIVEQSLAAVPGVTVVEVSLAEHMAVVTFDDAAASIEALTKATGDAGFPSNLLEPAS